MRVGGSGLRDTVVPLGLKVAASAGSCAGLHRSVPRLLSSAAVLYCRHPVPRASSKDAPSVMLLCCRHPEVLSKLKAPSICHAAAVLCCLKLCWPTALGPVCGHVCGHQEVLSKLKAVTICLCANIIGRASRNGRNLPSSVLWIKVGCVCKHHQTGTPRWR